MGVLGHEDGEGIAPGLTPLPGGYSGETFLAESAGERTVVRIYAGRGAARGAGAAEVDAAVMRLVRGLVPVPGVLEVRRADGSAGTPALLVTQWLAGSRLDEVLPHAEEGLAQSWGRSAGSVLARLAQMPMPRAGSFLDGELRIGPFPPGGDDLVAWVDRHVSLGPLAAWESVDLARLRELADRAQGLLDDVDRVCLVHGDLNAKNLLVDHGEVVAVLDWEFAHAGSPLSDLGNLLRFERRPAFVEAVLATYSGLVVDAPTDPHDLLERARAADLWALVELASRPAENPVTTAARALLRVLAVEGAR